MPANHSHSDRIAELSELAGGLAHEIRNPLSTLKVNLQLLAEDLKHAGEAEYIDPDLQRRAVQRLETLRNETDRLQRLLNDFLKLASRQDIETRDFDVNALIQQLAEFFQPTAHEQDIQFQLSLSEEPLVCPMDASLLKQAVLNLIINAQQAMPDGGRLMISTSREASHAVINIEDTGMGVSQELLPQVFTPFFSTKKEGTGLGLSMTRRIIDEHHGTITVRSEPQQGTCFTITLPLSAGAPTCSDAAAG